MAPIVQTLKKYAPWIITAMAVAALVGVLVTVSVVRIRSSGRIVAVGLEVNATSIDWGEIPPGGSSQVGIRIRNNGTVPVTVNFTASNYTPAQASCYMSLSSDLQNTTVLDPGEVAYVKLTLKVQPDVQGFTEFSFDVFLTATRVETSPSHGSGSSRARSIE